MLLISIRGLEKQRMEEGRGSLILGRGPRKTRCLGGGSIDTLGIEKVSNASCRAPQRMRVSDAFVSLYGKMIARGFWAGKAAAAPHSPGCRAGAGRALFAGGEPGGCSAPRCSPPSSRDVTSCPRSRRWHWPPAAALWVNTPFLPFPPATHRTQLWRCRFEQRVQRGGEGRFDIPVGLGKDARRDCRCPFLLSARGGLWRGQKDKFPIAAIAAARPSVVPHQRAEEALGPFVCNYL